MARATKSKKHRIRKNSIAYWTDKTIKVVGVLTMVAAPIIIYSMLNDEDDDCIFIVD